MQTVFARHWFKFAAVAVVLVLIGAIAYQTLGKKEVVFPENKPAPAFELEKKEGGTAQLSDTEGKVRLVYFFYSSCPDVCPQTTLLLSGVQQVLKDKGAFAEKTHFYSVTFDPKRDTAERLNEFAATFGADAAGWTFLRGDEANIVDLAKRYGVGVQANPDGIYAHTNVVFLVDKKGSIRQFYDVSDPQLTKDKIAADMLALYKQS